jgi:hypothetical protein
MGSRKESPQQDAKLGQSKRGNRPRRITAIRSGSALAIDPVEDHGGKVIKLVGSPWSITVGGKGEPQIGQVHLHVPLDLELIEHGHSSSKLEHPTKGANRNFCYPHCSPSTTEFAFSLGITAIFVRSNRSGAVEITPGGGPTSPL